MCIWDNKSSRLVLRCVCLTSMNHEVVCGDDREIFVTIIEGSLEFDLILLQLWNKIAWSSSWPPSFKSFQITSSLLSLCSHLGHKAFKNVPASGLSCSYYNLRRIRFWQVKVDFPSHGSQVSLAFLLSSFVIHGMYGSCNGVKFNKSNCCQHQHLLFRSTIKFVQVQQLISISTRQTH